MSLWSTIAFKVKEIIQKMVGARTIEQVLHVTPAMSNKMEEAIQLWSDMYEDHAPWIKEPSYADPARVVSLGLPALISSEKARMALIEMESEITTPTEDVEVENPDYAPPTIDEAGNLLSTGSPKTVIEERTLGDTARAEFLNEQYKKLKKNLRTEIEYGIAKGGLIIKPYVTVDKESENPYSIEFDYIQADAFYPLAFNAAGKITEAAFIQTKVDKNTVYKRLEYHKLEGKSVQVVNKCFKSTNTGTDDNTLGADLGQEVPLTEVPEWSALAPSTTIANVEMPMFAYFKMPEANTIDTRSPLGVSGFSRARNLIKDADMQYSRLLWEYEAGEMAIDIDRDALNFVEDAQGGHSVLSNLQNRLYRKIDLGESNTFEPFAPALRDTQYLQGLNAILMRIEDTTGLSRGTLSDAAAEARTATELKILKQRSYQTNADIQAAIESALRDVIYIMNAYCSLYEITPDGDYDVNFEWDDSIISDVDSELGKRITLMQNGLAGKIETRMWYFGETERQAREALEKISQENVKSVIEQPEE